MPAVTHRREQHAQRRQQQVGEVGRQVQRRLQLDLPRQRAAQDARQNFLARLNRALGPAVLLALEAVHVHRQLRWRDHVREEDELPALELRPVAQVEIFGERVVLPAARFLNA